MRKAGRAAAFGAAVAAAAATPAAAQKTVTVTGKEFAFEPDRIVVPAGEDLRIEFKNAGALSHNLTVKRKGGSGNGVVIGTGTIQRGATASFEFDPAPGTYRIECTVPGHAEAGMTGKLVVKGGG